MTLSRWLRDYLYFSLGGNRKGSWMTMRNLFLTMFLGGLWHGASWNFAVWGVLHGVYLALERLIEKIQFLKWNLQYKVIRLIKWFVIFHLVCLAWIFFRAQEFSDSYTIINNIVSFNGGFNLSLNQLIHAVMILSMPLLHYFSYQLKLGDNSSSMKSSVYIFWQTLLLVFLILFYPERTGSFMYFQF